MVARARVLEGKNASTHLRAARITSAARVAHQPGTARPSPSARPIAEVSQIEAAVVSPWMLTPSLKITPAPRKPTPVITPWARRVGSRWVTPGSKAPGSSSGSSERFTTTAEASATRPWVRSPAMRPL